MSEPENGAGGGTEGAMRASRALATLSEAARPLANVAGQWDCMRSGDPAAPDETVVTVELGQLRALCVALRAAERK